jgi:hypothetical protein
MRQVRQPTPRPSRPAPGTTGIQVQARPALLAWRDRLDRATHAWPRAADPPPAEEVNPMAKLRQFVTWLVLVTAPTALLLIETAGNKLP